MYLRIYKLKDKEELFRVYVAYHPSIIFSMEATKGECAGAFLCTLAKSRRKESSEFLKRKLHLRLAKWVLRDGGDLKWRNKDGKTPRDLAKDRGAWELYETFTLSGEIPHPSKNKK